MYPGERAELEKSPLLSGREMVRVLSLTVVSMVVLSEDSAGVVSSVILVPLNVLVVAVLFLSTVFPRSTAVFLRLFGM